MPPGAVAQLAVGVADRMDPAWPPVLVAVVVTVGVLAVGGVTILFCRLRAAARAERLRPRGGQR
jgi:hypothetical protein